jgi:hypothetical protein
MWYQINAHQGSLLLDAAVATLGYALLGDRFGAWLVVPGLYLVLRHLRNRLPGRESELV